MTNFRIITCRNGKHLFFLHDRCLYSANKQNYYVCIEEGCNLRGKLIGQRFEYTKENQHNHNFNHTWQANSETAYQRMSVEALTTNRPLKAIYNEATKNVITYPYLPNTYHAYYPYLPNTYHLTYYLT